MIKKYTLENLGCAHCASKMEEKINRLDGVSSATISYPTKLLILDADEPESLIEKIQEICSSIESEVKVVPRKLSYHDHHHEEMKILEHHHHETCSCGHDHEHDHHHEACSCNHDHEHDHHHEACSCGHDHEYDHHHEACSCGHDHEEAKSEASETHTHVSESSSRFLGLSEKHQLVFGIVLTIAAYLIGHFTKDNNIQLISYLVAYLFLAREIILKSVHNIGKGQIFDENFLMSIATIGAFCIGEYAEALGVILFYRIGEAFEDYAVEKSRASIMETVNMRPESVIQVHGDHTHEIPAQDAVPGMVILVRPGDRIPLDGIVVEGNSQIDTSALTGEPVPVSVKQDDEVLSGCLNQTAAIKLRVTNALEESMVTRIMESMENAAASKPQIDRFISRFAKIYTPFVVFSALATAILPSIVTGNWNYWIYTALTFLVISCPCALVLSVPLAFFSGIGLGSKHGILFKGGASLEVLKDVKAVVMDKTGTITQGNFVVQSILPENGEDTDALLSYAATCEQSSTHPIAKSILQAAKQKNIALLKASEMEEDAGHGVCTKIEGKEVLCGNEKLMKKHGIFLPEHSKEFGTEVYVAIDGTFAGRILISDTLKADSKASISLLNESVQTVMLTGDSTESAKAIADETGIKEFYAKLLPNDKLDLLQKLRKKYGSVMFVGDGINDAPVLAGADCGAAMGSGADAAIEAADVVFMTSELSAIPKAIKIAKITNSIAVQNIVFALIVKALVLIFGILGYASMWLAVFADTGVAVICIINSVRILLKKWK